nr:4'-phosphopantetheinyl transferase superfamily protein [Kineococcus vitellinus]
MSTSHSADHVLVAATRCGPVGVDAEEVGAADFDGFDGAVLAAQERDELLRAPEAAHALLRARWWTRKEAVLKATGHGLTVAPAEVVVAGEPPALRGWPSSLETDLRAPVRAHLFDLAPQPGVEVAVAVAVAVLTTGPEPSLRLLDGTQLLSAHR